MNIFKHLYLICFCLLCTAWNSLVAQCNPDVTEPIVVCAAGLEVALQAPGEYELNYAEVDVNSFDVCSGTDLTFLLQLGAEPPAASVLFDCSNLGYNTISLIATDAAGNQNTCWTTIAVIDPNTYCPLPPGCDPDVTPPVIVCEENVVIPLSPFNGDTEVNLAVFLSSAYDGCSGVDLDLSYSLDGGTIGTDEFVIFQCEDIGLHNLLINVADPTGNENSCSLTVEVKDKIPPVAICNDFLEVNLTESGFYELNYAEVDEGSYDNCSSEITHLLQVGNQDPAESILLDCSNLGQNIVSNTVTDDFGNQNTCWLEVVVSDPNNYCQPLLISGHVFFDENQNCSYDTGENGASSWDVEITNLTNGFSNTTSVGSDGYYELTMFLNSGMDTPLEVRLPDALGVISPCGSVYTYVVSAGTTDLTADLPLTLDENCPLLLVDIATDRLRFCAAAKYHVNYCNLSTETIEDSYVEVTLDEDLTFVGSSIPLASVNNGVYTFNLGDLPSAECGEFTITVNVTCEDLAFQTPCVEARIYPAEICTPSAPFWSGASIQTDATCDGDFVYFRIRNIGTADMTSMLDFQIVEDVVMYMQDTFKLSAGEDKIISVPANGATWRIDADQEPGHPGSYQPAAWLEACGGINSPGVVNLFPTNNTDPFVSVFCLQIVAAYDPNDKQGFPLGLYEDHLIEPNQSLDYMVRFQNTGNDTAFKVIIVDTLAETLDWTSIRPGASSHPYRFESTPEGVIRFIFDPIALPDSNVNEAASHGFVRFHINQKADLPLGTVIENSAAIYFDANEPVITNLSTHTLGRDYLVTSNRNPVLPNLDIKIAPNPFTHTVFFDLQGIPVQEGTLDLFDNNGKKIRALQFTEPSFQLSGQDLAPGVYFFNIQSDGQWLGSGKLIVQ